MPRKPGGLSRKDNVVKKFKDQLQSPRFHLYRCNGCRDQHGGKSRSQLWVVLEESNAIEPRVCPQHRLVLTRLHTKRPETKNPYKYLSRIGHLIFAGEGTRFQSLRKPKALGATPQPEDMDVSSWDLAGNADLSEVEDDDEDDSSDADEEYEEKLSHYSSAMRLTGDASSASYASQARQIYNDFDAGSRLVRSAKAGPSAADSLNKASVMAKHLALGVSSLSASTYLGVSGNTKDDRAEWCHIIADCLGGMTIGANLFAGSFACNSFMEAIETTIKGYPVQIDVTVECSKPHCGSRVTYKVSTKKAWSTWTIDAQAKYFNAADQQAVWDEAAQFLKDAGLK